MLPSLQLLMLPAGLLAFLSSYPYLTSGEELRWPYNLPSHAKYYPGDEVFVRQDEDIQQKMQTQPAVGVKKMSDDEGEKFYLRYWTLEGMGGHEPVSHTDGKHPEMAGGSECSLGHNNTAGNTIQPAILLHSMQSTLSRYMRFPLLPPPRIYKRDFQCPGGTSSCVSIGRPNRCCGDGQTCQQIQDTGLGDVGCCPAGETCGGSLANCASGYTSCPNDGGACCMPGFSCVTGGCLLSSTATVVVTPLPSPTPSPSPATTAISSSPASSSTANSPTSSAPSTSQTPTVKSPTLTSTSSTANTLVCSSGFRSCPASLGGGCCPQTRACGRDVCPELSTTATMDVPVRPTSNTPTTTSDAPVTGCPTGFYACSAFYQGGCCRFGRDCAPTSCPTGATTTIVNKNSVTIIATTSAGLTANPILTGACATGWSTCGPSDGGGCCPSGFVCGRSCTATATVPGGQASEVGKLAPNTASHGGGRGTMWAGIGTALLVLLLLVI